MLSKYSRVGLLDRGKFLPYRSVAQEVGHITVMTERQIGAGKNTLWYQMLIYLFEQTKLRRKPVKEDKFIIFSQSIYNIIKITLMRGYLLGEALEIEIMSCKSDINLIKVNRIDNGLG